MRITTTTTTTTTKNLTTTMTTRYEDKGQGTTRTMRDNNVDDELEVEVRMCICNTKHSTIKQRTRDDDANDEDNKDNEG